MKDGSYQVTYRNICAGFTVEHGHVTQCAPILRKRIEYWTRKAKRLTPHLLS